VTKPESTPAGPELPASAIQVGPLSVGAGSPGQAIPPQTAYQQAAEMLRHYSTMRGSIVSFLLTTFFGLGGWALSNPANPPLAIYLLVAMAIVLSCAAFSSMYFSANIANMRRVLIDLEGGKAVNLFNSTVSVTFVD
jgi:hypothetical protein